MRARRSRLGTGLWPYRLAARAGKRGGAVLSWIPLRKRACRPCWASGPEELRAGEQGLGEQGRRLREPAPGRLDFVEILKFFSAPVPRCHKRGKGWERARGAMRASDYQRRQRNGVAM